MYPTSRPTTKIEPAENDDMQHGLENHTNNTKNMIPIAIAQPQLSINEKVDKSPCHRPPNSQVQILRHQNGAQTARTAGPNNRQPQHNSIRNSHAECNETKSNRFSCPSPTMLPRPTNSTPISTPPPAVSQSKPTQNETYPLLFMALAALTTGLSGSALSKMSCNKSSGYLLTSKTTSSKASAPRSGGLPPWFIGGIA